MSEIEKHNKIKKEIEIDLTDHNLVPIKNLKKTHRGLQYLRGILDLELYFKVNNEETREFAKMILTEVEEVCELLGVKY